MGTSRIHHDNLLSIYNGRVRIGHVLAHLNGRVEAFDIADRPIGIFKTIPAAANAIADATEALTTIPDFVPRTRDGRAAVINAGNTAGGRTSYDQTN